MLSAARVTDKTFCEHDGGVIALPCCPKVLADNQPTARFADRALCPSPPDTIQEGSRSVLIGGLPASRTTDGTFHQGVIMTGLDSVLIGGAKIAGKQVDNGFPFNLLISPSNTFIAYDPEGGRMFIVSYLEYHGPNATQAYADAAKKQIEEMWSGQTTIDGKSVDVRVQINTSVKPDGPVVPVDRGGVNPPPTPGYDRIYVDDKVERSNQTLAGGRGNQNPKDVGGKEQVAAHEYGHTLGLDDQYKDTPTGSVPDPTKTSNTERNIMVQTWPDKNGNPPHPYPEHYEQVLKDVGLR